MSAGETAGASSGAPAGRAEGHLAFVYLRASNNPGAEGWGIRVVVECELDAEKVARAFLRAQLEARGDRRARSDMEFIGLFYGGRAPLAEAEFTRWGDESKERVEQ